MTRKIPDVVLERYRLNELEPNSARTVEAMLAADSELRARLDALEISDTEIRRDDLVRVTIHDRPAPFSPRTAVRFATVALVAAAAVILILVIPRAPSPSNGPAGDRLKGTVGARPSLSVYRRTAAGSERMTDGDLVHAGDLLRLGYASAGRPFGVILSIDGRGTVTMHLPPSGDRAAALQSGSTVLLDAAYELDDAPRIERFYFITAGDAFAVAPVMQAAKQAAGTPGGALPAALSLPAGLEQTSFAIGKEERK